jgi:hypothetical protein
MEYARWRVGNLASSTPRNMPDYAALIEPTQARRHEALQGRKEKKTCGRIFDYWMILPNKN